MTERAMTRLGQRVACSTGGAGVQSGISAQQPYIPAPAYSSEFPPPPSAQHELMGASERRMRRMSSVDVMMVSAMMSTPNAMRSR